MVGWSGFPGEVYTRILEMFQGRLHFVSGLFLSLTFHSLGYSQSTFGSITGTVTDPAAALVPVPKWR